jgi:DNA-directed RNA polymerase specialized sigma24 family protein
MNPDQYFREVIRLLERRLGRMIMQNEVRAIEVDDIIQFFCEWLLNRPKVVAAYTPAAIVSVATRQRVIEYIRAQHRQTPAMPFVAGVDDKRMHMTYLDEEIWGPTGWAPEHHVPAREFEDGDNGHGEGSSHMDRFDSGVRTDRDALDQQLLGAMLQALSPIQLEVFTLVKIAGYTVTEAAKQMGIRRERASIALGHAQRVVTKLRDDWDA